MARFQSSERRDPYRNFNFRIFMGGVEVAACRKMSGLDVSVNAVKFRAGNSESSVDEVSPGRVEVSPVTFEAGITNDRTLENWANQLVRHSHHAEDRTRLRENAFRKDVEIRVFDIDGVTLVRKYMLYYAWPSKYTALSDLAGDGNDTLIETLELTHEGFDRIAVDADSE